MKTQETLHGGTAAFIAAIANALSRNITVERMHELASRPTDLKRLLLPLVDDEWVNVCPLLNYPSKYGGLVGLNGFDDIHPDSSNNGKPYDIRDIIKSARRHCLGFINEGRAEHLAQMVCSENEAASTKHMTGRIHDVYFPFACDTQIFAWRAPCGNNSIPDVIKTPPGLLFDDSRVHRVWYFHLGYECHMEKYFT